MAVDNNALGSKRWGAGFDLQFGAELYGNIGDYLDNLSDLDNIDIGNTDNITAEQAEDVVELLGNLGRSPTIPSAYD